MKPVLRKIFSKIKFVIIILILALVVFFFWGWGEKQFNKVKGAYMIYKGDQAYFQDNMGIFQRRQWHSSTLAWQTPWTEEPGRLQSMVSLGVGHD